MRTLLTASLAAAVMASGLVLGGTAIAQQKDEKKNEKLDPNERICETQTVVGSRLATRRICMTRAQWAEQRNSDRDFTTRTQTTGCVTKQDC